MKIDVRETLHNIVYTYLLQIRVRNMPIVKYGELQQSTFIQVLYLSTNLILLYF